MDGLSLILRRYMEATTLDHVTRADSLVLFCLQYKSPQLARTFVDRLFCNPTGTPPHFPYLSYNARTQTETLSKTAMCVVIRKIIATMKQERSLEGGCGPSLCKAILTWAQIDKEDKAKQLAEGSSDRAQEVFAQIEMDLDNKNEICYAVSEFLLDHTHATMKIDSLHHDRATLAHLKSVFGKDGTSEVATLEVVSGDNGRKDAWVGTKIFCYGNCI